MKKIIFASALAILAIFTITANVTNSNQGTTDNQEAKVLEYTCPMHPDVISDKPGDCPKCGMTLLKNEVQTSKIVYTCPMHKDVVSDKPGKCPRCGMKLKKKEVAVSDSTKVKKACCGMLKM